MRIAKATNGRSRQTSQVGASMIARRRIHAGASIPHIAI
jgi:hypothetical protein